MPHRMNTTYGSSSSRLRSKVAKQTICCCCENKAEKYIFTLKSPKGDISPYPKDKAMVNLFSLTLDSVSQMAVFSNNFQKVTDKISVTDLADIWQEGDDCFPKYSPKASLSADYAGKERLDVITLLDMAVTVDDVTGIAQSVSFVFKYDTGFILLGPPPIPLTDIVLTIKQGSV